LGNGLSDFFQAYYIYAIERNCYQY